ncbi:SRPBCC family protein [Mycobacterium sp.]|uniref:SRPBCC family protein n=1 Tax=Mycobacterium sp. TaxID=1785 RepID=UPI0025D67BBF|nr:SRPBCC family protein [Mycobacterium sp.]
MVEFTLTRSTTAPIEAVFDSLTDHRGISNYSKAARRSTLDREGTPAPNGVGARRRIEAVGPAIVEEIIEYERPHRYAYKLISGAPVRDHVGTVTLRPTGSGTEVSWHLTSTPKLPGLGLLLTPVLKRAIGELLNGAVDAAEGRA